MLVVALVLAGLIGVSLGLLGGGGSILTVPILTYVVGVDAKQAIAMSLVVVGFTSAAATLQHARAGNVNWRMGFFFGASSMLGAFAGGHIAKYIRGEILLAGFGAMMLLASLAMLRGRKQRAAGPGQSLWWVPIEGVAFGLVVGLIGAGGGFLVVPALALLGGLPMKHAVGTSLFVIAMNSFAGAAGHLGHVSIDWVLTLGFAAAAVAGSFVGMGLLTRVRADTLRKVFGGFVLLMGIGVLGAEAFKAQLLGLLPIAVLGGLTLLGAALYTRRSASSTEG